MSDVEIEMDVLQRNWLQRRERSRHLWQSNSI